MLFELHCRANQFSILDTIAYTETGKFIRKEKVVRRFVVVPDSVIENLYNRFCGVGVIINDSPANAALRRRVVARTVGKTQAKVIAAAANVRDAPETRGSIVRTAAGGEQFVLLAASRRVTAGIGCGSEMPDEKVGCTATPSN